MGGQKKVHSQNPKTLSIAASTRTTRVAGSGRRDRGMSTRYTRSILSEYSAVRARTFTERKLSLRV